MNPIYRTRRNAEEKAGQAPPKLNDMPCTSDGLPICLFGISSGQKKIYNAEKALLIWKPAGAMRMIIMAGKVNRAIGMIILTGAL